MQVLAWGPTLTVERAARSGATFMELDALLEEADIVTVQLKLSEDSRGLLNEQRLRRIGPEGVLINTARGAIVARGFSRVLADAVHHRGQIFSDLLAADSPLRPGYVVRPTGDRTVTDNTSAPSSIMEPITEVRSASS